MRISKAFTSLVWKFKFVVVVLMMASNLTTDMELGGFLNSDTV